MPVIANRTGGQICLSILGRNITTNAVDLYRLLITTGDPITLSVDPLSSGNFDYQTVNGKDGTIVSQVQLDEQEPNGEISCSFYEDFDYLNEDYVYGNSKNVMLNLFNGESFKNGEDIIVPIGTNGTDKKTGSKAKQSEMNLPFKMLFHNEGAFIKAYGAYDAKGNPIFKKNPFEASFNQSHKTFCFEALTSTGAGQVNRMYAVVAKNTMEWAEGDINNFNMTGQRGCDMFERNDFFTEVVKGDDVLDGNDKYKEVYVDYILKEGATNPSDAKDGEILAITDASGTISIKKYATSAWGEDSDNIGTKLQAGTRIKSNCLIEDGSTKQEVTCFTVVGMDGKAVDFSTDGTKRYFCKVMDYNRDLSKFEDFYAPVD